ncbi:MAG: hypothetical protein ACKVS9_05795 [Phycisphaerae bacterium]
MSSTQGDLQDAADRRAAFERGEIDAEAAGLVHFSRACWLRSQVTERAAELRWGIPFFLVFVGILVIAFRPRVASVIPPQLFFALVVAAIALVLIWMFVKWYRRGLAEAVDLREPSNAVPSPSVRVCFSGSRKEVLEYGPLQNVPFEPQQFTLWLPPLGIGSAGLHAAVSGIGLWASFVLLAWVYNPGFFWNAIFQGMSFFSFGALISVWIWPTHLRITPGCAEVMEYGPFRSRPKAISKLDIGTKPIIVDLRRRTLFVDPDGARMDISFEWTRDPARVAFFLLLGAISTHRSPSVMIEE